mgnify:CR=1 FL=1
MRAFVDRADVTPGKPFTLTVEVDRRMDVVFDLPDVGAKIEGLVIMNQGTEPAERVLNAERAAGQLGRRSRQEEGVSCRCQDTFTSFCVTHGDVPFGFVGLAHPTRFLQHLS